MKKGVTLVELVITLAIVAGLVTLTSLFLVNYRSRQSLDIEVKKVAANLREVQQRAVTQQDQEQWGIRFDNPSGAQDFYKVFKGPNFASGTVVSTEFLSPRVKFSDPAEGAAKDVIFSKITGLPNTATSVTMELINGAASTTISINAQGRVSF